MGRGTKKSERRNGRVMATGTFDIIHPGHIFYLKRSKNYGNELHVVVARDITPKNKPIIPEKQRKEVVESIKFVDRAYLGNKKNKLDIIEQIKPDVLTLGPDQNWDKSKIQKEIKTVDEDIEVVKITEYKNCQLCSTSKIINKILKRYKE